VGICVGVGGEVVVDDVGCVGKIESSAGEVGGDHDLYFHFTEAVEQRGSPGLVNSAVDKFGGGELLFQMAVEFFGASS